MNNWKSVSLGQIGLFSKGAGISKAELIDEGIPAVRYGELYTRHHIKIKAIHSFVSPESATTSKPIKKGDLLFAGSGETIDDIGKSAVYLYDEECLAGGDIVILSPKGVDPLFLSFYLNSTLARRGLRRLGQGQSVVHVYKRDLENLEITIPGVDEQKRIVAVVETWDEYLDKLDKKIELKGNIKKSLLQQLLSGHTRIKGFSTKWKVVSLGDISHIKTGKKDNQNKVKGGTYPFFVRSPNIERIDSYSFDGEAILVPGEGNIGKIFHYINGKFDYHQRVYKISDFDQSANGKYIHYYFTQNFAREVSSSSVKATVDSLRLPTFTNFKVSLPPIEEQDAIVRLLDTISSDIDMLLIKKLTLESQKKYLLDNLLSGKISTPKNLITPAKDVQHA